MGPTEIMNFTKCKVLPNPESSSLTDCDDNSATHILAAAVYCQLERNYFDETRSRSDVAALFRCNTSQLTKAITGVEYKGGPHKYKPKPKSAKKRASELGEPSGVSHTKLLKTSTKTTEKPTQSEHLLTADDTLETESSSSDLPPML